MIHPRHKSKAFTLVELLVSITVVVVLASIVLYGMAGMQNLAKAQRTKSQIAKIHELIAEQWEGYEVRRVSVPFTSPPVTPIELATMRLAALRELIRYELPDRQSDMLNTAAITQTILGQPIPALAKYYDNFVNTHAANPNWGQLYQGAECLYMIISRIEVDDMSALEMFSETDIGDVDNDGMPEILDGWGNPIRLLRWPAAYPSPLHPDDSNLNTVGIQPDWSNPLTVDYQDPFDVLGVGGGFLIFPLVVSSGPDGEFGIGFERKAPTGPINYDGDTSDLVNDPGNDPFKHFDAEGPLGDISDTNTVADNITNHLLQTSIR
jgi:prepilin-type N-terminal cleavage/methylation domain-containing protein